ncbi:MAG TPA: M50 family metallopeptidase, partial [Pyrinomonadaceae bacterium]|nr:M50 family metallopeptidase [Pyrinomonadaceae bacterium]
VLWFIPFADYLVYPIRLFVTFIHESSHALIAVLTGGSVQSLTISMDGSGVVYSAPSGTVGALLTSSAGYLGTLAFGVLMLYLIRRSFSPNKILTALGIFVAAMTLLFTVISPIFNFLSLNATFSSIVFTIVAGGLLAAALVGLGIYSSMRTANFAVAFLAVQCLLNAVLDLFTVFFINAPLVGLDMHNDATNMSNATGVPGIVWVVIWMGISLLMISFGLRLYAVNQKKAAADDSVFESEPSV